MERSPITLLARKVDGLDQAIGQVATTIQTVGTEAGPKIARPMENATPYSELERLLLIGKSRKGIHKHTLPILTEHRKLLSEELTTALKVPDIAQELTTVKEQSYPYTYEATRSTIKAENDPYAQEKERLTKLIVLAAVSPYLKIRLHRTPYGEPPRHITRQYEILLPNGKKVLIPEETKEGPTPLFAYIIKRLAEASPEHPVTLHDLSNELYGRYDDRTLKRTFGMFNHPLKIPKHLTGTGYRVVMEKRKEEGKRSGSVVYFLPENDQITLPITSPTEDQSPTIPVEEKQERQNTEMSEREKIVAEINRAAITLLQLREFARDGFLKPRELTQAQAIYESIIAPYAVPLIAEGAVRALQQTNHLTSEFRSQIVDLLLTRRIVSSEHLAQMLYGEITDDSVFKANAFIASFRTAIDTSWNLGFTIHQTIPGSTIPMPRIHWVVDFNQRSSFSLGLPTQG